MFNLIIQDGYGHIFMQVMVSLLIFPVVSFKRFAHTAKLIVNVLSRC